MKYLFLGTAAALAIGSASQAQVTFSKGVGSFSIGSYANISDFLIFEPEFDTAFNAGSFGFQVGAGAQLFTDFSSSFNIANFDLHGYKMTESGNKFGAYISAGSGLFFGGGSVIGAEAMIGLGALDVEASVGYLAISGTDIILATVDVYVDVSPSIEISAGYKGFFTNTSDASSANVGAAYAFGDSGYSVNADYNFSLTGSGQDSYSVGLSWEFGPNTGERLFGDRFLDIFAMGGL